MEVEHFDATTKRGRRGKDKPLGQKAGWDRARRHRARLAAKLAVLKKATVKNNQPRYLPTPEEIADACAVIQRGWGDEEMIKRAYGVANDCEPYGLADWMLCPDCHKLSPLAHELHNPAPVCLDCVRWDEARQAGRICRNYWANHRPDLQDIAYHGGGTNRSDCPAWWEGL